MKLTVLTISIIFVLLTLTVGCTSATPTTTPEPVILEYIGHLSILIIGPDGTFIVSDPYGASRPKELALFPDNIEADVVTISHLHSDHRNKEAIGGYPQIISEPGVHQVGMVSITGYESDYGLEDEDGYAIGLNTVFVFEIGEAKIVHLGAAGVITQPDILAAIESADIIIMDIHGDATHPLDKQIAQM